jgi:polysaccharide biosynthesis/export protein
MKQAILAVSTGSLLVFWAGCAAKGPHTEFSHAASTAASSTVTLTNQLSPELLRPPQELFTLGPGDRVAIEIIGTPTSRALTTVGPDGKLYYNLLPGTDVWGLTLAQTRELLESGLSKYLSDPHVTVTLREVASKSVWLLGRLGKPGIYPMTGPMTLIEAMTLAGGSARSSTQSGTQELADLRHSFVMRQGQLLPVDFYRLLREGDMSQNIYLQPDDFVYVPSALSQQVYVLGAVRFPRAVAYTERMTLMSALSEANGSVKVDWLSPTYTGLAPDAYMSHVAVVRGSLAKPELMIVDASAVLKGKAVDVALEPGDIVYVPNTPYSTLKRYFNTIASTFISTAAANAGARYGGLQTVGIAVPVGAH